MKNSQDAFLFWAQDPARTLEERYGVLRLVEHVWKYHYNGPDKGPSPDWETESRFHEFRRNNPAYDPQPDPRKLRIIAGLLDQVTSLEFSDGYTDRPVRDLGFLSFVSNLRKLVMRGLEVERLDELRHLTALEECTLWTHEAEDFSPLAACGRLRKLTIHTEHPSPILNGLENLTLLEELEWAGNPRAFMGIPVLPAIKKFEFAEPHHTSYLRDALRDARQLPEMPRLEFFRGGQFYRLDGMERYARLRFICVRGFFRDIEALKGLERLTHLRAQSPRLRDVSALMRMPSVLHFAAFSDAPQDWSALMESETLREVFHFGHDLPQPDLETLRMLLPTWDNLFAAPAPRPVKPLRFKLGERRRRRGVLKSIGDLEDPSEAWDGNTGTCESEGWWAEQLVRKFLGKAGFLKLQGVRMDEDPPSDYDLFTKAPCGYFSRTVEMKLLRTEAIGLLRPIVNCLREALAHTRYEWAVTITLEVAPDADSWDESWKNDRGSTTAEELMEEQRYHEYQRRKYQIQLQNEHRFRLLQELGGSAEEFRSIPIPDYQESPPAETPEAPGAPDGKASSGKDDKDDSADDDDPASGGTGLADPKQERKDETWLKKVIFSDPNHRWNDLHTFLHVTEEGVHMYSKMQGVDLVAELLDLIPEKNPDDPDEDA